MPQVELFTIDKFYDAVEEKVKQKVEQEKWNWLVGEHFDNLVLGFFDRVKRLLVPLETKLKEYPVDSVHSVFEMREEEGHLTIRFEERTLDFTARNEAGHFEMQISGNGKFIKPFTITFDPQNRRPAFSVLTYQARVPEPVNDGHIIEVIRDVLMEEKPEE